MKTRITIALMLASFVALGASIAHAKGPSLHAKPKAARAKVEPYTRCAWGSGNGAIPAGWQELRCGAAKAPYAITPASTSWDDVEVQKPVIRVISVGSELTLGVNIKGGKEFVYSVAKARLPMAKAGEWYTPDPAVVAMFRAMEKQGKIAQID